MCKWFFFVVDGSDWVDIFKFFIDRGGYCIIEMW